MNWVGDLVQEQVTESDSVIELGCGIMQAILDVIPTYPKTVLRCERLVGVDIFQPYLTFLNKRGIETTRHDLTIVPLPFADNSFDVVLMLDVLEHLPHLNNVFDLIEEAIRIACKKVIILTPSDFRYSPKNGYEPYGFPDNEYLGHSLLIPKELLKEFGFKVRHFKKKESGHYFGVKKC